MKTSALLKSDDFYREKESKNSKLEVFSGERLSKNLQLLMKIFELNVNELHEKTGISLTTLKRMKANDDANPTAASLVPLANFFSVTINQLLGIDPLPNEIIVGTYAEKRLWTHVPILNWSEAATWPKTTKIMKDYKMISTDVELSKNSFALIVPDEGWMNFLPGSFLIIDSSIQPAHRDFVVIHKQGQQNATFRQLLIDEDKKYLKPLNRDFQTTIFDESYKIIGVMVQIRMDLKN